MCDIGVRSGSKAGAQEEKRKGCGGAAACTGAEQSCSGGNPGHRLLCCPGAELP